VAEVVVRFQNEYEGNPSDVLAFCAVKPGMRVTQADIASDVSKLFATGWYSTVSSNTENLPDDTVRVIYTIQRRYTLAAAPRISGNSAITASRLREWLDLREGSRVDDAIINDRCMKIRDEYTKRFYPEALVTYTLLPVNPAYGTASLAFEIHEGPRRVYSDFTFTGNRVLSSSALAAPFNQYAWYDPRGWFSSTPHNETLLEAARMKALELYLNEGYLDAEITGPEIIPIKEGKVRLHYAVDEGVRYIIESVTVEDATLFQTSVLLQAANLKIAATAGRDTLDAAAKRVRDYYTSRGYVDVAMRPVIESPFEGFARVRFIIRDENLRQIKVRKVQINGNTKTLDKVIRREITLSPGDILDTTKVELGENRLRNLNYFKEVNAYLTQVPGSENERDVVYELTETSTGSFMVGIGFSSVDNVIGFGEISQSNFDIMNWRTFTGAGQKARASVELGSSTQSFLLQWHNPWLFDRPLRFTTDLYLRQRSYSEYNDARLGGGLELSYAIGFTDGKGAKHNLGQIGYRATLEQVQMKSVSRSLYMLPDGWHYDEDGDEYVAGRPYHYTDEPDRYMRSAFRVFWGDDRRNRVFIPTRGYQWQVWSELAAGDESTYAAGANGRTWFEIPHTKGHVLSVRGRVESIDGFNGTPPITERLFLGGAGSVRGVAYRQLGPKVRRQGRNSWHPIGGQTITTASAEYTIPIVKAVRLGLFSDFGSLGADAFSPNFNDYMLTAGTGLRIDIPGFPIRLDFATPVIDNDSNARKEVFSFWIGYE
jgi:outer membrane protein insertion porin family